MNLLSHRTLIIAGAAVAALGLIGINQPVRQHRPLLKIPAKPPSAPRPVAPMAPMPESTPAEISVSESAEQPAPAPAATPVVTFRGVIGEAVQLTDAASPSETSRLVQRMAALGPPEITKLGAAIQAAPAIRAKAAIAQALAMIGTSEAVDQLAASLQAIASPADRRTVGQSLTSLSDMYGLETLTSGLSLIEDPVLIQSIQEAIAQQAAPETVQFLTELYRGVPTIPEQADNVIAALSGIANPAATDELRKMVSSAPELQLQSAAATSLGLIGTPEALEGVLGGLFRVADTNPPYRQTLLNVLATTSNPAAMDWLAEQSASTNLPADVTASINTALNRVRQSSTARR